MRGGEGRVRVSFYFLNKKKQNERGLVLHVVIFVFV